MRGTCGRSLAGTPEANAAAAAAAGGARGVMVVHVLVEQQTEEKSQLSILWRLQSSGLVLEFCAGTYS
jgi:hypothetical protein